MSTLIIPKMRTRTTIQARILMLCFLLIGALIQVTGAVPPPFIAYHDASSSYHQQQFDRLSPQGWRMISLSVYGDLSSQLYAVVWVKFDAAPAWAAIHGATEPQYQAFLISCTSADLHPILLTAAGSGSQTVFAGTCETRTGPAPWVHLGLFSDTSNPVGSVEHRNNEAEAQRYILTSATIYGTSASPLFAGIWSWNERGVMWNAHGRLDDSAGYQARFDAEVAGWARPSFVTLSASQRYLSVFVDDQIGPWVARHGLTSSQYQSEFNTWTSRGFYPFSVQAGGSGPNAHFAVLFAQSTTPLPRFFTASGPRTVAAIDEAVRNYMKADGVRGATLGIVKNRRLLYAKAYTWAEKGYPLTDTNTTFRVASCSKTVTSIAIHQLIQERLLSLDDPVQNILHLTTPSGSSPVDSRWNTITIRQLLEHTAGTPFQDPDPNIAQAFGVSLPITKMHIARSLAGKLLNNDPGRTFKYSNLGYLLLTLVIERLRGTSYIDAITSSISSPLGITHLILSRSLVDQQPPNEARYHDSEVSLGFSVLSNAQPLVPNPYGPFNIENWDGFGGLSINGVDFARVLAALNTNVLLRHPIRSDFLEHSRGWDFSFRNMDDTWHAVKGGAISGLQSMINYNQRGISYFIAWNKNGLKGRFYPDFPALEAAIAATTWDRTDLFKSFGLSSL